MLKRKVNLFLFFFLIAIGCASLSVDHRFSVGDIEVVEGKYDRPPEPIGGYYPIQSKLTYPRIAWEAGIKGTVVVRAFVNVEGEVEKALILSGIPYTGLDEAALSAVRQTKFNPAVYNNEPVSVWIAIPVKFVIPLGYDQ